MEDFKQCNTCDFCILDIGTNTYECYKSHKTICNRFNGYEVCKPTQCANWKHSKA